MKTNRKFMFLIAALLVIVGLAFAIVAVNYATRRDLDGHVPMGSVPATCNTLVGENCTLTVTATVSPTATAVGDTVVTSNNWMISLFDGATPEYLSWQFPALSPEVWGVFPNVDNPHGGLFSANGLEYGEDEVILAGTYDLVVPARSYLLITGDYAFDLLGSCSAANRRGCALMITNVGDVTASFNGTMGTAFSIYGRYWNGDPNFLTHAIVACLSHATHNMLNLASNNSTNAGTNAGANCSAPSGCVSVNVRGVIVSGNQPLVAISTIANR